MSADPQDQVQDVLDRLVADGVELGLQAAVYRHGKIVVDACAGRIDGHSAVAVTPSTLFPVFSTTKGLAATILHLLVERGEISYETPIADVWPEFGAHGKGLITLRHVLSHSAGIPQMPRVTSFEELCDWNAMCAAIADLAPLSPPGSRVEYHAMSFGWITAEVARRVDGRGFGQLVREEICGPLGLRTLFVGLPDAEAKNVATLEEANPVGPGDDTRPQAVPGFLFPIYAIMNRADVRRACLPSTNGLMNARAIAAHYAALLPGGAEGVRLLSDERVRLATEPHSPEWGLGYQLRGGIGSLFPGSDKIFGHGGYGGSIGLADRESGVAIGVTKNRFNGDLSVRNIVAEIRGAVGG